MNEIITQVDAQNKMEKSEVSPTLLAPVCMTCFYLRTLRGTVHSMQACVYAAPCMLLSGDLVDAPYLLLSVCAHFSASLLAAALLPTQKNTQHILSCTLSVKCIIIVIILVFTMQT